MNQKQVRQEIVQVPTNPAAIPGIPAPAMPMPYGTMPAPQAAAFPYYPYAPATIAPVRRVVHPTRYIETHTVTRYPVVHVYPTHMRKVHHNVYEHYCEYPHSESDQICEHKVECCNPPQPKPSC
ncbi:spore coat protein [Fodinisporobacter ferrooxydans]|uniref:Spore coat protein n=1 Tax=Fodinisporobacter ferrooxydans TaxID=2901836 RepID=A0ABY4CPQ0_9BACL|nr:spore coat protein [Alicyclobacillaceae bacterium MYW30-H2]